MHRHKKYAPTPEAIEVFNNLPNSFKESLKLVGLGFPDDGPPIEIFTCADCPHVDKCEFAFDAYNTDDDCLAEK